jgi:hypothetical protein
MNPTPGELEKAWQDRAIADARAEALKDAATAATNANPERAYDERGVMIFAEGVAAAVAAVLALALSRPAGEAAGLTR